jgi:hypothetical protein
LVAGGAGLWVTGGGIWVAGGVRVGAGEAAVWGWECVEGHGWRGMGGGRRGGGPWGGGEGDEKRGGWVCACGDPCGGNTGSCGWDRRLTTAAHAGGGHVPFTVRPPTVAEEPFPIDVSKKL